MTEWITIRRFVGTYVYRVFDGDGQLVYIGMTSQPTRRLIEHARHARWWPDKVRYTLVGPFADRAAAKAHEKALIVAERPLRNYLHNGGLHGRRD